MAIGLSTTILAINLIGENQKPVDMELSIIPLTLADM